VAGRGTGCDSCFCAGIGSEGYVSLGGVSPKTKKRILDKRRFYGCELKPEYAATARNNLTDAVDQVAEVKDLMLFADM
jgi:hypothetical protein